jgi:hypothetical protein
VPTPTRLITALLVVVGAVVFVVFIAARQTLRMFSVKAHPKLKFFWRVFAITFNKFRRAALAFKLPIINLDGFD